MLINLIVANTENGVIGKNGSMPWSMPQELKRFRKLTKNSIVLMGRKTYETIGKPLDSRHNYILTKSELKIDGAFVFSEIEDALKDMEIIFPNTEIFIIGGATVYKMFLESNLIDKIYQTLIHTTIEGDAFFDFKKDEWNLVNEEKVKLLNYENLIDCSYLTWEKEKPRN
jgi:dihydrofolate reductase